MSAYYNEIDPFAAAWLRELIKQGHIADGVVDERSIEDVTPDDLCGFTQCHFFAGIGVWSYALRQAGWSDDRPVWTGSCPCQPFSAAGKGKGTADERHLWPVFRDLIEACKPDVIFGEQVSGKPIIGSLKSEKTLRKLERSALCDFTEENANAWLRHVQLDMEDRGYGLGSVTFPACSIGAPHQRKRLYWVADSGSEGLEGDEWQGEAREEGASSGHGSKCGGSGELADSSGEGLEGFSGDGDGSNKPGREQAEQARPVGESCGVDSEQPATGPTNGQWGDCDWLFCRDGKWRPVEPSFEQMVNGVALAVVYLRDECGPKEREVIYETAKNSSACEIMQAMRGDYAPEAVWLQIGGQVGFHSASILLAALCQHQGELGGLLYGKTQGGAQASEDVLRAVRQVEKPSCPPHRWEPPKQFIEQFRDSLSELPQTRTLESIKTINGSPLADGSPSRVGRLRGYGNAIVAQQAQAFIEAFLEV